MHYRIFFAVPLAFAHYMPVVFPATLAVTIKNVSGHAKYSLGGKLLAVEDHLFRRSLDFSQPGDVRINFE